jgi:ubiquitin C-terminal hydrolase
MNKGLSGLRNLGNTCYLNSTLQPLLHTYELTQFLHSKEYLNKINKVHDSLLLVEWDQLSEIMMNANNIIDPQKFVQCLRKLAVFREQLHFAGNAQNDMPECLLFILDCFHRALTRKVIMTVNGEIKDETDEIALKCFTSIKQLYEEDYSEIVKIFYGTQVTIIEDFVTTKRLNIISEPFSILNLPIPSNTSKQISLEDCLDLYIEKEHLVDENALKDDEGKAIDATKKIQFWSFPDILVVDIKRFKVGMQKNQVLISFPLEWSLSKYVIGYKKESFVYDLYAISNHLGGTQMGGHYTCFVKNLNGNWYYYNDTCVQQVNDLRQLTTPYAYCFFYRKRKIN